jgi:EPS-associated MarR family transcriptional regulator
MGENPGAVACLSLLFSMNQPQLTDADRYQLLVLLQKNPNLSQRQLAKELGMSLGKVNYCLRALSERGWIKVENFWHNPNKLGYLYKLTPKGIHAKTRITRQFLQSKLEEHVLLTREIELLRQEVSELGS